MKKKRQGFTLVEAVIVIAITGIIATVVAVFIQRPVDSYLAAARRAELTDIADTAVRRFARDVQRALPNSVRLANPQVIEFLSTRTGGRYRVAQNAGVGDILEFDNAADPAFDVLGSVDLLAGDKIVIYNLGIPGADAYEGTSLRDYSGGNATGVTNVPFTAAAVPFPFDSPSHAFHVVDTPVTYRCDLNPLVRTLTRHSGYVISAPQNPLPGGGTLLARNVSACVFTYAPGLTERSGLVTMKISITENNETVTLYHAVHVSNVP